MANNRLYLFDRETKEAIIFAKSIGIGWNPWPDNPEIFAKQLDEFLFARDTAASFGSGPKSNLVLITEQELMEIQDAVTLPSQPIPVDMKIEDDNFDAKTYIDQRLTQALREKMKERENEFDKAILNGTSLESNAPLLGLFSVRDEPD